MEVSRSAPSVILPGSNRVVPGLAGLSAAEVALVLLTGSGHRTEDIKKEDRPKKLNGKQWTAAEVHVLRVQFDLDDTSGQTSGQAQHKQLSSHSATGRVARLVCAAF